MLRMSVLFGAMDPPTRYEEVENGQHRRGRSSQGLPRAPNRETKTHTHPSCDVRVRSAAGHHGGFSGTEATRPLVVTNLAAMFAHGATPLSL